MPLTFTRISNLLQLSTFVSVLVAGLGLYLLLAAYINHYQQINLELEARGVASGVHGRLDQYRQQLQRLAQRPAVRAAFASSRTARNDLARRLQNETPYALRVRLLPANNLKADTTSLPHLSYACIDMLTSLRKNRPTRLAELHLPDTPSAHIAMAVPVTDQHNRLLGFLHLSLKPELVRDSLNQSVASNRYIALRQKLDEKRFITLATHGAQTGKRSALKEYATIPGTHWQVAVVPGASGWARPKNYWLVIGLFGVAVLIFLLGPYFINTFVQKTLRQDIDTLIDMISDIRAGKLKQSYPTKLQEINLIALQLLRSGGKLAEDMQALLEGSQSDTLTGVATEKSFRTRVDQLFDQTKMGFPSSVLLIDIDRMAEINDTYGHEQGDKFLRAFVTALRSLMRGVDFIGRVEGDRFGILFSLTPIDSIQPALERLQKMQPYEMPLSKGINHEIYWSGGLSCMAPTDNSAADVIIRAGRALNEAQQAGGGQVCTKLA